MNHWLSGLVVDCETVAIPDAGSLVEPVSAPSNYKDEAKIAEYVAKAQQKQIDDAALFAYTARVICLGWLDMRNEEPKQRIINSDAGERDALKDFWFDAWDQSLGTVERLITFNGRRFDLPLLMVRSMILGVKHPVLNLDRYRTPHLDVSQLLSFDGLLDYKSLRWYAKRFGLNCDDAFSGEHVADLYAAENWDAIRAHNRWDLVTTKRLAEMVAPWRTTR